MVSKIEIRLEVKARIEAMSQTEKEIESQEVSAKLIEILSKESFQTIVTYDPMNDEIDIREVNAWAKNNSKTIVLLGKTQLDTPEITEEESTVCLVIGRAFTKDGKRLGRGMGFYDQLLAKYPKMKTIGVCFSCQIFEDLPQDSWDQEVSRVVFGGITLE